MDYLSDLKNNKMIFFNFMKNKYPIFFNSNIFLRDIQYAINTYFAMKQVKVSYQKSERLAMDFISHLEGTNELIKLNENTWKVNFNLESDVIKEETVQNEN